MATYYVRTTGSDSNGGTDPVTDAKLTVQAGVNLLADGDTLDIGAGTFSSTTTITVDDTRGGSTPGAPTVIRGAGPTTILTSATNSVAIITTDTGSATYFTLRDLKITHTAATRGVGLFGGGGSATQARWAVRDVEFDGCSIGISDGSRLTITSIEGVTIRNCTGVGVSCTGGLLANAPMRGCKFIDNAGGGVSVSTNASAIDMLLERCVFSGNTGDGLKYDASTRTNNRVKVRNCVFEGNTGDGLDLAVGSSGNTMPDVADSVFYGNGGYGVVAGTLAVVQSLNRNNAFGSNTSGAVSGWFSGDNDITLSADPFTNEAGEDWSPNNTAGGGAELRYAGAGGADIGAVQHQAASGSGGGLKLVGTGGLAG